VAKETFEPRLKVFLSADIVGSTALKQSYKDDISDVIWPSIIQGFYRNFIEAIDLAWFAAQGHVFDTAVRAIKSNRAIERELRDLFGPPPKFWKTIGDEVIFWKEITCETQMATVLAVWLNAVREVRDFSIASTNQKSMVWT
jgi:class 3 adenylate cyclase